MSAPRFTGSELNAINVALDGLRESLKGDMRFYSDKENEENRMPEKLEATESALKRLKDESHDWDWDCTVQIKTEDTTYYAVTWMEGWLEVQSKEQLRGFMTHLLNSGECEYLLMDGKYSSRHVPELLDWLEGSSRRTVECDCDPVTIRRVTWVNDSIGLTGSAMHLNAGTEGETA